MIVRCPGRVNLIGEHTDYNDGFVLPIALPFETVIAACPSEDAQMNLISEEFGPAHSLLKITLWAHQVEVDTSTQWEPFYRNPILSYWAGMDIFVPVFRSGQTYRPRRLVEIAAGMVFKHFGGLESNTYRISFDWTACRE